MPLQVLHFLIRLKSSGRLMSYKVEISTAGRKGRMYDGVWEIAKVLNSLSTVHQHLNYSFFDKFIMYSKWLFACELVKVSLEKSLC